MTPSPPMLAAHGLARRFGKISALAGIDLTIGRGELFALIGPDGAGKSTFFRITTGLLAPSSGSLAIAPGTSLGYVPQRFSLYEDLTVDENLRLRTRLYSLEGRAARQRSGELLEHVGLTQARSRLAGQLSGGMKQKLALVSALLTAPDLLLLDEPTTGVDPVSRREFWLLLNGLHHDGITIVVSTPYMDEAEYATRVGFLDRGRLSAVGTPEEIASSYTRTLLEIHTDDRLAVRDRLRALPEVDDLSLFGTELHARGAAGAGPSLLETVRRALEGLVPAEGIRLVSATLEDVFVLKSEEGAEEAA